MAIATNPTTERSGIGTRAWWSGTISTFLSQTIERINDRLAFRAIEAHPTNRKEQLDGWHSQITILKQALATLPPNWKLLLGSKPNNFVDFLMAR
jgi:hypothetical protein